MKMPPLSNEENAWIQFLTASDNSIFRDLGATLMHMIGASSEIDSIITPLKQKSLKEWEPALLLAECLKQSEDDYLFELSTIMMEWFSGTFETDPQE